MAIEDFLSKEHIKQMYRDIALGEIQPWAIAAYASSAAVELDNYAHGEHGSFESLHTLTDLFDRYQLKEALDGSGGFSFPYIPVWNAIRNESDMKIRYVSELAFQMHLMNEELKDAYSSVEKAHDMSLFLVRLSQELLAYECMMCVVS